MKYRQKFLSIKDHLDLVKAKFKVRILFKNVSDEIYNLLFIF